MELVIKTEDFLPCPIILGYPIYQNIHEYEGETKMSNIKKPIQRGKLRQIAGKEYYIIKRKINWILTKRKYTRNVNDGRHYHSVFTHRSLIMRPLKDVDMYLQENKKTNLALAIKHLDGIEIKPGEYFSFWKLVGRPTKRKGYLEGLILNNGTIDKGIGGGLCQLGNLLFWIFAHSPLTIVERYRHGFDVFPDVNRKIPFGAGATLSYNYIDLQVKNETDNSFVIKLWMDDTYLNGELLSREKVKESYHIEERNHRMNHQFWGGYSRHNQIFQIIKFGNEQKEKLLVENHAIMMYEPFLEGEDTKTN